MAAQPSLVQLPGPGLFRPSRMTVKAVTRPSRSTEIIVRTALLVLQAPPSVVAGMLGYHTVHAEALAAETGSTWKKYAPGDHGR